MDDNKKEQSVALSLSKNTKLVLVTFGLMGAFLAYGIVQERIMTTPYGFAEDGSPLLFTYSAWLVLNNRLVSVLGALVFLYWRKESFQPVAPIYKYFGISISNVAATYCQYEALKYVSFPTQTLGKCGKTIPVMILGTTLSGKTYLLKDYMMALSITVGCTVFMITGDISESKAKGDTPIGLLLMAGYLFMDGFTSTFQEKLFRGYTMSTYNQMLYVNLSSAAISIVVLTLQGNLLGSFAFALTYPRLMFDAFMLSMCAFAGQLCIFYTIKEFGAYIFTLIMTTRQFLSILLSCLFFFHPLTGGQWVGTAIVFATLFYETRMKKGAHGHGHGAKPVSPKADIEAQKPEKTST